MNSARDESPPPPPINTLPPAQQPKSNSRTAKECRLLSDLWLMSAATFRRLGKIEQAKAAIQEAEVKDESNPSVWVQVRFYVVCITSVIHDWDVAWSLLQCSRS
jgi:hypothetical protein